MRNRAEVLQRAQEYFGLGSGEHQRGHSNQFYIESPARMTLDSLSLDRDQSAAAVELPSPEAYLSGIEPPPLERWFRQPQRRGASFSIVLGEYGLGKTELMFRVAEALQDGAAAPGQPGCLPIMLASCARELHTLDRAYPPIEFVQRLLGHLATGAAAVASEVARDVVDGIRRGEIVLLLDALDELVSELREHRVFLESVGRLVAEAEPPASFHIVISMRLEHLLQVGGEQLGDVAGHLKQTAGRAVPVRYLLLDFFDDATVDEYIAFRVDSEGLVEDLPKDREFRDMLRRPLLARILCDLVPAGMSEADRRRLVNELRQVRSPASLLELFTGKAEQDEVLQSAQQRIHRRFARDEDSYVWSHERLAATTLDVYRRGDSQLTRSDVERILVKKGGRRDEDEIAGLSNAELELSIYKCPFLSRQVDRARTTEENNAAELRIRFTHRVFFEYYTTKGVVAELVAHPGQLTAFHDLVLNVDMHRFLRDLTIKAGGERLWYAETARAYGLKEDCRGDWVEFGVLTPALRERLDAIRKDLLDARSGLIQDPGVLRSAVSSFLAIDRDPQAPLPPRYQIPNYEAVAVCLLKPSVGSREMHHSFSALLDERMSDTVTRLAEVGDTAGRLPYELLVERLLDVGHRCLYPWVKQWRDAVETSAEASKLGSGAIVIADEHARQRISKIMAEIARMAS